jgi:hypothetical protein
MIYQKYGVDLCRELGIGVRKGKPYSSEYYKQNIDKFRESMKRYNLKKKKVSFNEKVDIHYFTYELYTEGPDWFLVSMDRHRFNRRVQKIEKILEPILRKCIEKTLKKKNI